MSRPYSRPSVSSLILMNSLEGVLDISAAEVEALFAFQILVHEVAAI